MGDPLIVELLCPCGWESQWSVFVSEDLRRCAGCGRLYGLRYDELTLGLEVELFGSDGERGLEVMCSERALTVSAHRLEPRPASILLTEGDECVLVRKPSDDAEAAEPCDGGTDR